MPVMALQIWSIEEGSRGGADAMDTQIALLQVQFKSQQKELTQPMNAVAQSKLCSTNLQRNSTPKRLGIGSDECKSKISIQKSPYDSSSYQSLAGPSPILIIDGS